jgi:hypothetical protein
VLVAPAQDELQGGVQVGEGAVASHQEAAQIRGLTPRSTTRSW